jgi:hypothetical protein
MASSARAVRIRRDPGGSLAVETPATLGGASTTGTLGPRHRNDAGSTRAFRTFLFFLVALAVIYGVFISFAAQSASNGANSTVEAVLTASVAVALVVGWWVTLGQAPTVAYVQGDHLVVQSRTGRARRFPMDGLRVTMMRTNGRGFLGPDPTEFVELSAPGGPRQTYLVGSHFFDFAH